MTPETSRRGKKGTPPFSARAAWKALAPESLFQKEWSEFRHRDMSEFLHELGKRTRHPLRIEPLGNSVEGRTLWAVRMGRQGGIPVLVWCRQHGNEPDCTGALCTVLDFLLASGDALAGRILEQLDLLFFPMVNPDGVTRFKRHNAQGIDINRDAQANVTPEGRALVAARDWIKPRYCFNLHDMGARKLTPEGELVAIAFQAGPFEDADTDNETRLRAKMIIAEMAAACRPYAPKNIAKYTADYMPRAFGDSMMRWGVSSILIESGGWYDEKGGDGHVVRLHALALLAGLEAVASRRDSGRLTGKAYEAIPFDSGGSLFDLILERADVMDGSASPPMRADVAINVSRRSRRWTDTNSLQGLVENLGDLPESHAKARRRMGGVLLLPGVVGVCPGARFVDGVPSSEEVAPHLRAGVTTIVTGFGPFSNSEQRDSWLSEARHLTPPIHIIAFERIDGVDEIRRRHGMTEFAGMCAENLIMTTGELVDLMHLYHPAHHSALTDEEYDMQLRVDLMFSGAASPRRTRLNLLVSPARKQDVDRGTRLQGGSLRDLAGEFLGHPSQLGVFADVKNRPLSFLPVNVGRCGFSRGRLPRPEYLTFAMRSADCTDEGSFAANVNLLTQQAAKAFRISSSGLIRIGHRADLVGISRDILDPLVMHRQLMAPLLVVLNGQVVVDVGRGIERSGQGLWHFTV